MIRKTSYGYLFALSLGLLLVLNSAAVAAPTAKMVKKGITKLKEFKIKVVK